MKLQLWLNEVERDTLATAIAFFMEEAAASDTVYQQLNIRGKCTAFSRRRMKELLDRIALPPSAASVNPATARSDKKEKA